MSPSSNRPDAESTMRRVLAATDLSSRSDRALRRAALLAKEAEAELLVLHAVDDDQPRSLVEVERREAWALLQRQMAGLPELQAVRASALVDEGDPFEAVLRVADAQGVDIIVLGEHRRSVLRDIFTGTTVERVIRHGTRPVLMVNQPPAGPYRRILAATDLSEHAEHALRTAARLGLLRGAAVTVLHAYEPEGMGAITRAGLSDAEVRALLAEAARRARGALDGFVAGLDFLHLPQRLVEEGRPATIIKEAADRLRPDLLVMGTAGAGLLRRMVLGSVAAEAVGEVRCDALVVPPENAR
jgi:nucleotide-binding universal stress UspA family protein